METILLVCFIMTFGSIAIYYVFKGKNTSSYSNIPRSDIQTDFLLNRKKRIMIKGNEIYIQNHHLYSGISDIEKEILTLAGQIPVIRIFENENLIKTFRITPKDSNPDLNGKIFECEIRVNANFSVQIEGTIYSDMEHLLYKKSANSEYLRFQPFHLSHRKESDEKLVGRGMIARGLHYPGYRDGGGIRLICICDHCCESFSVDFYHAGFSELQYFYSSNSKETLMVSFDKILEMPAHLQENVDEKTLEKFEKILPKTEDGEFKYYNPFCCPHCLAAFNDYRKFKLDRPNDIYAHFYLNQSAKL